MFEALITIQSNWEDIIKSDKEKVWAYYKRRGEKSINGHLNDVNFSFRKSGESGRAIMVLFKSEVAKILFVSPFKILSNIHENSITSLDVSHGGLGVSVSTDKLLIWETKRDIVRRRLEGHIFDVYTCRFFPSGVVILSGGADMQLKIWDAITGASPVALKGHTAAITDTAIIDKGKNIISVSKDATVRLWNCGEAKCLDVILDAHSAINCCSLIEDKESGIENNHLLAVGCESGDVYIIGIDNKRTYALHRLISSVLCMCWVDEYNLTIGTSDGSIYILNLQNIATKPKLLCHDSLSEVLCMIQCKSGFIIGRRDGICQFYNKEGISTVQFTGPDCDPIYSIAKDETHIYTACRDSKIRIYRIKDFEMMSDELMDH